MIAETFQEISEALLNFIICPILLIDFIEAFYAGFDQFCVLFSGILDDLPEQIIDALLIIIHNLL